jgi:adenine-specific DNA-methyltransferase
MSYLLDANVFIYRDRYQHSSWLAMLQDRLLLTNTLLAEDGLISVSIDEYENDRLGLLGQEIFPIHIGDVVVHRKRGRDNSARDLSKMHDYLRIYGRSDRAQLNRESMPETTKKAYRNPDQDNRGPYRLLGLWARGGQGGSRYSFTLSDGYEFSERLWLVNKETMMLYDAERRLIRVGDKLY